MSDKLQEKNDKKSLRTNSQPKSLMKSNLKGASINLIDNWPSFAGHRDVSSNQLLYHKNHINVLNEAMSKMPKNVPKPQLLQFLDKYLEDQFKKHGVKKDEVNPVRLQIYREVFDWLIESFKTYQPLLSKIKHEYEVNLSFLKEEIRQLEPMKEILWTIAEERDQQILTIKKQENNEIKQLKQEKLVLIEQLSKQEANDITFQYEVNALSKSLKKEHEAYKKEADARKLLIMDINEIKTQMDDLNQLKKDRNVVKEEDPVMLRMALEVAVNAQALAVKELSNTKALYSNSVPASKYEQLEVKYTILVAEHKSMGEKMATQETQLKSLEERYNALNQQRDFYYFKYMDLAKSAPGNSTTIWDKYTDVVGGTGRWQELSSKGKTVSQLAQIILEDLTEEPSSKNKISLKSGRKGSSSSLSDELDNENKRKSSTAKTLTDIKENKAVMRTMIEMMCDLPPGSISPAFDPMMLLPILNKETVKTSSVKDKVKHK